MRYCGIDFGTSNSAIAIGDGHDIALAPVDGAHETLPSALFFPTNALPLYGRPAQAAFFEGHEGRFMRSLKRMLGTELMNWGTLVNARPRRFDELIGGFVAHLKKAGEEKTGDALDSVVMGRPVHFVDGDTGADFAAEEQLRDVAKAAGFNHIAFQYEPIAAAFAHERKLTKEALALVADVGGGTSDFTVIRLGPQSAQKADRKDDILGNAGLRTGGNDFDKSLSLASFMPHVGYESTFGPQRMIAPRAPFHDLSEWSKVNFVYTPKTVAELEDVARQSQAPQKLARLMQIITRELGHRLLAQVEDLKILLSTQEQAQAALDFIENDFHVHVSADSLSQSVALHVTHITDTLTRCLAQAGVKPEDIDLLVLTGGPTAMPLLRNALVRACPRADISEDNKLSSVGLGLGFHARALFS